MGRVVIDGSGEAVACESYATEWPGTLVEVFQAPDELVAMLERDPTSADAVVLGPNREQLIQLAEQVVTLAPDATVIVVAPRGQTDDLRREAEGSPLLGGRTEVVATGPDSRLVQAVREGIDRAEQGRRYHELVAATQPEIVTLAVPLPPPANLLGRILEYAPIGVIITDGDRRILDLNPRAEDIFRTKASLATGVLLKSLFEPGQHEALAALLAQCDRGDTVGPDVFEFDTHLDDQRFIEISATKVPGRGQTSFVAVISQDVTERMRTAQYHERSLREKEVLLKEIHHRVKNNLAAIGSLLYLQSTATRDPQALRVLRDCQDRVRSMALVHERLYSSDDLASVDFAEYTEELAQQLFRNYAVSVSTIQLKLDLVPTVVEIGRAIPCGLILTELISNALKHGFPDGRRGQITVTSRYVHKGDLVLTVADNGVGLPEAAELEERSSLGMRLVRSFANQLNARIEFRRTNPGTEAKLTMEGTDDRTR